MANGLVEVAEDLKMTLSMCSLSQYNSMVNSSGVILDLVLSNTPIDSIMVNRHLDSLMPEDIAHPTLQINLK